MQLYVQLCMCRCAFADVHKILVAVRTILRLFKYFLRFRSLYTLDEIEVLSYRYTRLSLEQFKYFSFTDSIKTFETEEVIDIGMAHCNASSRGG